MPTSRSPVFSSLLVLGSMISLTVGSSIAKTLFPVLGPAGTTFLRLAISTVILTFIHRPWKTSLHLTQWRWIVLYGAVLGSMNLLFYFAIARLPIGLAIGIEFLGPLALALFLSRSRLDILWAFLALLGVLLILPHSDTTSVDPLGIAFALGAALGWAAYIIASKKAGQLVPSSSITTYGMAIGALAVTPFGLWPATRLAQNSSLILPAIGVGVLSSAIPYTLEILALKNMEAKTFGIVVSAEPAIGALSAFVLLSEHLSVTQMLAIAFVMSASIGSTVLSRRPPTDVPTP